MFHSAILYKTKITGCVVLLSMKAKTEAILKKKHRLIWINKVKQTNKKNFVKKHQSKILKAFEQLGNIFATHLIEEIIVVVHKEH